jgi:hypothetical protein
MVGLPASAHPDYWALSNATINEVSLGQNRYEIQITQGATAGSGLVGIRMTNPNDVITKITVYRNPAHNLNSILLNISNNGSKADFAAIEAIDVVSPSNRFLDISLINITGNLGTPSSITTIEAGQIRNIDISGNWYANVVVDDQTTTSSLNLNTVRVRSDWLGGGLYWNTPTSFGTITVDGDISGSSIDPIEIWSKNNITSVSAGSITNARIGSQTNGFSGFSAVTSITTTNGDFVSSAPMTMASLGSMDINGDFDAEITLNGAMGSLSSLYQIRDSFASTALLSLPANGLLGTILINTNNASGQFLGDIEVGSTVLSPDYTTLSSALGNGATGLAPFNFHQFTGPLPASRGDLDCDPFHTEYLSVGACEEVTVLTHVDIEHYGPVFVRGAADQYRVEFRPAFTGGGPTWFDVSSQFVVDTTFTATTEANAHRVVRLINAAGSQTDFAAAGWFRFRPLIITKDDIDEHQVRCAWVNGNPGVAYDSSIVSGDLGNTSSGPQYDWYQFRVGLVPCPPESMLFEGDQVNASDIAAWIDQPFEVNMDGQICSQDLADMLAAYNAQ